MINRELHEALGYCWHKQGYVGGTGGGSVYRDGTNTFTFNYDCYCSCGEKFTNYIDLLNHCKQNNSDYKADPRLVLREMEKREDWIKFAVFLHHSQSISALHAGVVRTVPVDLILDQTGKLAQLALDFLPKEEKRVCDTCNAQKDGHYCLLHSKFVKNMDIDSCDDWEATDA